MEISLLFPLTLSLLILLSSIQQSPVAADDALITNTCKKTPLFPLCVSTIRSDPRSKNEDVAGLGLIVVAATKTKAIATLYQIKKLLGAGDPKLRGSLSKCVEFYNTIIKADIPEAEQALRGVPKFAEDGMADSASAADSCERGFGPSKSPITAMNKAVHDLAVVARAIIRLLL